MPNRYVLYWGDQPVTDLRTLTTAGFTQVRRHGVRLIRFAKNLVLTVLVLSMAVVELSAISLGLAMLAFVLAVLCALFALLLYTHAQRLLKIQPDDLLAVIAGEEVDGRGTVIFRNDKLTWMTTQQNVRKVAALPDSAFEALAKINGVPGGVTTRAMSPEEAAEYVEAVPVMSEMAVFLFVLAAFASLYVLGSGSEQYIVPIVIATFVLRGLRTLVHRHFRRMKSSPMLTVRTDTTVGRREVSWAEFTPDGRPWTLEGEPAMWRRP